MNAPTTLPAIFGKPGYNDVLGVLEDAFLQTSEGKGAERHAKGGKPFDRQPIMEMGRMTGVGGPAFQALKKTQEAVTMHERGEPNRAIHELHGAIIYLVAAVLLIEEGAQ